MESSLKIGFKNVENFGLQPIVTAKVIRTEDPRDQLLKAFFEQLGHISSWLYIELIDSSDDQKIFDILPVKPESLEIMATQALSRISNKGLNIKDNSTGFRDFLKSRNIEYCSIHDFYTTLIDPNIDPFILGMQYEQYKKSN